MLLHVRREGIPPVADPADVPPPVRDLVASFQRAVVDALVRGLVAAARAQRPAQPDPHGRRRRQHACCGARPSAPAASSGLPVFIPPLELTSDNAAMIAAAGFVSLRRGVRADLGLNAEPHLALG